MPIQYSGHMKWYQKYRVFGLYIQNTAAGPIRIPVYFGIGGGHFHPISVGFLAFLSRRNR